MTSQRFQSARSVILRGTCALCGLMLVVLPGCAWLKRPTINPIVRAHELTSEAEEQVVKQDYVQAEKLYRQALRVNPDDGEAYRKLAELQSSQNKISAAISSLKMASLRSSDDPQIWYELGRLQYSTDDLTSATLSLDNALKYDPVLIDALKLRALIYDQNEDYESALVACQRVLAVSPHDLRTRIQIADLEIKMGRPERAAPILRNLCECDQAEPAAKIEALWKLGEAYAQVERWQDAKETFSQVQQKRPLNSAEEWYRVAYVNYMTQNWDAADVAVQNALRLQKTHSEALILASSLELVRSTQPLVRQAKIELPKPQ